MGIFRSASNATVAVFNTVTEVANTAGECVSIATQYIHNRAVATKLTDRETVKVATAETLLELQTKLDADEKLKALYNQLDSEFA